MAINAGTISAFLELNTSNFSAGIASANSQLQALSDDNLNAAEKIKGVGGALTTIGGTLTKNLTVPLVGAGAAAVTVAANFDAGMSKVQAISGATGEDLDRLRDKAREMGAKTKFSASEAADAMSYMAMAGWKTGDMLDGIEGIMNLAAASGEDLATTSDIVTDALTAFGLSAKDSAHFSDILAAASSNANTNVSMMGESFKYCAPIAGAMGFSAEDTAEALGLMANSGIKASQAGTALRFIMAKFNEDIKISGKELGEVTIQTTNADGSMRDLSDILADCRGAFSQLTESEKSANAEALGGKYAMSGLLSLMNAAPEDIGKLSGAIDSCDGTAQRTGFGRKSQRGGAVVRFARQRVETSDCQRGAGRRVNGTRGNGHGQADIRRGRADEDSRRRGDGVSGCQLGDGRSGRRADQYCDACRMGGAGSGCRDGCRCGALQRFAPCKRQAE